jgi:hypothetical protein
MPANNCKHFRCKTQLYYRWSGMLDRCRNPKSKGWKDYGARGIAVCEHWLDFRNFAADVGEPPPGQNGRRSAYSLDRIDNDKGYEPDNVGWATRKEQANNRRQRNRPIRILTERDLSIHKMYATGSFTQRELAEAFKLPQSCVSKAISHVNALLNEV